MVMLWNFLISLLCILCIGKGDILRLDACNKISAIFNVVLENSLLEKTVYSLIENINLNRCLRICMQYPKCKSFSYMLHYSQCRIHQSTSADKETFLQDVIGWVHYETSKNEPNLGPVCEERKPCYGRCVDTCDTKGYKCECKGDWVLLKRNLCFGARANEFGTFEIQHDAVISAMKLVYVGGGGVTCFDGARLTNWGCEYEPYPFVRENVAAVITDDQDNILYPSKVYDKTLGFFFVPGYNADSPFLIFNATNHTVHQGQKLRLHYGEALLSPYHFNNLGQSCVDIYAELCDA
ncbi:uncharacterized protein LOC130657230 [Hydractinia symbiolongicarpus]|uniref:uncharacterized protein LOC130657230 n=1 Tax=Hydractinia symbiolongicarpus TaxID=13093 RepID=UPI00254A46D1|nr:uncharacterized protein LOC130657230 [Hydractinia symbiolongicarpus]